MDRELVHGGSGWVGDGTELRGSGGSRVRGINASGRALTTEGVMGSGLGEPREKGWRVMGWRFREILGAF